VERARVEPKLPQATNRLQFKQRSLTISKSVQYFHTIYLISLTLFSIPALFLRCPNIVRSRIKGSKMVFFVCNKCQETLKLKAIDIHHCNSTFCCVDCSKDFTYDAVRSHNSCVSEAEKYEKGLYKGKKIKVDPQEVWTQQINRVAETASKHKALFQRLIGYTNVPRKAGKFINFAQNSLAVRDPRGIHRCS
jgi:cell growth-regulating nucleolar protein